jgi:hypothetical protein
MKGNEKIGTAKNLVLSALVLTGVACGGSPDSTDAAKKDLLKKIENVVGSSLTDNGGGSYTYIDSSTNIKYSVEIKERTKGEEVIGYWVVFSDDSEQDRLYLRKGNSVRPAIY